MAEPRANHRFKFVSADPPFDKTAARTEHGTIATHIADGMEIKVVFLHRDRHDCVPDNPKDSPVLDCPVCIGQDYTNGKQNHFCGHLGPCNRGHWAPADDNAIAWITTQALEGNLLHTTYRQPKKAS